MQNGFVDSTAELCLGCRGRKRKMLSVLPEQRKAAFPKKSGQRFSSLLVCYFRLAKTTAPASVRTALNSIEKSTERLISISPMRHNCPNTMRKQASDGVKRFIASLLCRATAPTSTSGPFFVSEPRMPEMAAGAWVFRRCDPTETGANCTGSA